MSEARKASTAGLDPKRLAGLLGLAEEATDQTPGEVLAEMLAEPFPETATDPHQRVGRLLLDPATPTDVLGAIKDYAKQLGNQVEEAAHKAIDKVKGAADRGG